MLDPSSSEEESDELLEEERRDVLVAAGGGSPRSLPPAPRDSRGREAGAARAASPSPSVLSEGREEQERLQREEREKRLRLQLYVFIARCIAHPFNAKQPTDMARRQQKDTDMECSLISSSLASVLTCVTACGWLSIAGWPEVPCLCYVTGAVGYSLPCPSSVIQDSYQGRRLLPNSSAPVFVPLTEAVMSQASKAAVPQACVVWSFAPEGRKALERGKEASCQINLVVSVEELGELGFRNVALKEEAIYYDEFPFLFFASAELNGPRKDTFPYNVLTEKSG
ncbi:hypothetical protein TURU_142687 [Turdus rufiventris]|nr:hypothetical protein TURU_142687 [Turdus rufiventris]